MSLPQGTGVRYTNKAEKIKNSLSQIEKDKNNPFTVNVNENLQLKGNDGKELLNLNYLVSILEADPILYTTRSLKDGREGKMSLDDPVLKKYNDLTLEQINSLNGQAIEDDRLRNDLFRNIKEYDTLTGNDTYELDMAFDKCINLEKSYYIKHIELWVLSSKCQEIYGIINQCKDLYHELRKLRLDCDIGEIRIPLLLDLGTIVNKQKDNLKSVNEIANQIKGLDTNKVPGNIQSTIVGGAKNTESLVYNNSEFENVFQQFDEFMRMKKQDVLEGKKLLYRNVISLNKGWEAAAKYWKSINDDYIKKAQENGEGLEIDDETKLSKLIDNITNGDIAESNRELQALIDDNTIKKQNSFDDAEKETIIESYFLKCKLYEYLYIAKHNEFLSLFNFYITLVLDYIISYIIIVIYVKTLYKEKCITSELPPSLIQRIERLLKPQTSLFATLRGFFEQYLKPLFGQVGGQKGGKNDQLEPEIVNKLDFINKLSNLFQEQYNNKDFYKYIDRLDTNPVYNDDSSNKINNLLNELKPDSGYDLSTQAGGGFVDIIKSAAQKLKDGFNNILRKEDDLDEKIKNAQQVAFIKKLRQVFSASMSANQV